MVAATLCTLMTSTHSHIHTHTWHHIAYAVVGFGELIMQILGTLMTSKQTRALGQEVALCAKVVRNKSKTKGFWVPSPPQMVLQDSLQ